MNLILSGFGSYPDFFDIAVKCAKARACVPVHVLTVLPEPVLEIKNFLAKSMGGKTDWANARAYWVARWIAIYHYTKNWDESEFPIFCADWDMLICRDLRPGFKAVEGYDYATTLDENGSPMGPHVINSIRPLAVFSECVESMIENGSPALGDLRDMELWESLSKLHWWNVGHMECLPGPEIYDHGLQCNLCFRKVEMDGKSKKVIFAGNNPCFISASDGKWIPAAMIHCWGGFKPKMKEFAQEMGVI